MFDALADMPVPVMVATTGSITRDNPLGNAFLADYLPGDAAVARSQLVICNGSSPTSQQALAQGIAVLGICCNFDH